MGKLDEIMDRNRQIAMAKDLHEIAQDIRRRNGTAAPVGSGPARPTLKEMWNNPEKRGGCLVCMIIWSIALIIILFCLIAAHIGWRPAFLSSRPTAEIALLGYVPGGNSGRIA